MVANSVIINMHRRLEATGIDPIASGSDWKRLQAIASSSSLQGKGRDGKREATAGASRFQSLPVASDSRLQSLPEEIGSLPVASKRKWQWMIEVDSKRIGG